MNRLEGKRGLVVGASRGIGSEIARKLASEGASLALSARDRQDLESVACRIHCGGRHVLVIPADCSVAAEAAQVVESAHESLGGLEFVVNVAGIHPEWARMGDQPLRSWDRVIAVNLSGSFYICRAALPLMVAGGGGSIVNISSVAAFRAWALVGPYNVSKAGLEMMTRTIALEYAAQHIRANCVAAGVIDAGITDAVLARDPGLRQKLTAMHPIGRLGLAEEVAEATTWLLSDQSSFTTGTSLVVDGGFLA